MNMEHNYLLQQPKKLESLTTAKLGEWVALQGQKLLPPLSELHRRDATQAETLLSQQIEIIRNHLNCNVPRQLFNSFADKAVRALEALFDKTELFLDSTSDFEKYLVGRMVETLFSKNLTYLEIRCQYRYIRNSIFFGSHMLTSLRRLELKSANLFESDEADYIMFLRELHSLQYLSFRQCFCTMNIVKCITQNCKLIEELDLSETGEGLNDDIVYLLTQLSNLRIVNLAGTWVGPSKLKTLLLTCENIENIENEIGYVLELLSPEEYTGKMFKIKTCSIGSQRHLQLIVQMCPQIHTLTAYPYKSNNLMALAALKNLRELTLRKHDFYNDQIKEALQVMGSNLVHLELNYVSGIDLNALFHISQVCPNLQSLTMSTARNLVRNQTCAMCTEHRAPNASRASCDNCAIRLEIPPFRKLRTLTCTTHTNISFSVSSTRAYKDYTSIIREQLLFVFSNCLNVEFIKFGSDFSISGDFMLEVLDKNPLICLKELEVGRQIEVPMAAVDRLIHTNTGFPEVKTVDDGALKRRDTIEEAFSENIFAVWNRHMGIF